MSGSCPSVTALSLPLLALDHADTARLTAPANRTSPQLGVCLVCAWYMLGAGADARTSRTTARCLGAWADRLRAQSITGLDGLALAFLRNRSSRFSLPLLWDL